MRTFFLSLSVFFSLSLLFSLSLAAFFLFFSCENQAPQITAPVAAAPKDTVVVRLSAIEFDSLLKAQRNLPLIDVRSEAEYTKSHIFRSVNCDVNAADFRQRIVKLGTATPVAVYDDSGTRSLHAAEIMRRLGFSRVYELAGGNISWSQAGKTLVSSAVDSARVLR